MASLVQNNNEHSLTSPEQKCTGEFGALAGDKSPSLPGTTNRGLWKVYDITCKSTSPRTTLSGGGGSGGENSNPISWIAWGIWHIFITSRYFYGYKPTDIFFQG